MKKLINNPVDYVPEMLEGLVSAFPTLRLGGESGRCISRSQSASSKKVGIVSGGGSGHLPLFTGYVGDGFLDACAIGNVFEGPNVQSCLDAIKVADHGAGVLCLFGNYGGDRMNFEMARDMAELEGISCEIVLGADDVASAPPAQAENRRGVAGIVLLYKIAGAAADEGRSLGEVTAVVKKAAKRLRTIGVALSPCQLPTASSPNFEIAADEMEMGMGIHGEPGIWRAALVSADKVADELVDRLFEELSPDRGGRVVPLVNGLGATPLEELFILWRRVAQRLDSAGIGAVAPLVGNYVTSMEMAGASLTFLVLDDELEALIRAPAHCPFLQVRS